MKFTTSLTSLVLVLGLVFSSQAQNMDYGAVPALTKPQGDQGAANQNLDFHTDLFTGRFNYEIPVEVPPGRQGSQPSIALQYNSSGGNGWCGVGWDLDMGYIQRDTRHGVPMSGGAYSDAYGYIYSVAGQSGRLVQASDGTWRPEIDKAFLKFVQTNGYWVVTDKTGTTYTFGNLSVSTISGPGSSGIFKWMLNTIQDANGNLTTIGYINYSTSKQLYLNQISYGANVNNSALTNNCVVELIPAGRPDSPNSCLSGQEIDTQYILGNIYVYCDGAVVRHYNMKYLVSPNSGKYLLDSVTEYGTNDSIAWPTITLGYTAQSHSFQPAQQWNVNSVAPDVGDLYWTSPSTPNTQLIDINGDGLPDWVSSQYGEPMTELVVQTNTGSGFGPVQHWSVSNESGQAIPYWNSVDNTFASADGGVAWSCKLVDINGDGLPDRVMVPTTGASGYFQVQTNTGSGFGPVFDWLGVPSTDVPSAPSWNSPGSDIAASYAKNFLVDMNGDGLADLLMWGNTAGEFQVALNNGASSGSFASSTYWGNVADSLGIRNEDNQHGVESEFMDMNGDGLPDRVTPGEVQLNLGWNGLNGQFESDQSWGMISGQSIGQLDSSLTSFTTQLMDMNGDGLPDLVTATSVGTFSQNDTYSVAFNTGKGFASPVTWTGVDAATSYASGLQTWDSTSTEVLFIDMNGDGLLDRVFRNNSRTNNCIYVQLSTGPYPDLLNRIYNGMGGEVDISYTSSTAFDNSDGTKLRLPFPVQVVTSVTENGNMGSSTTTTYGYQYGLYDTTWREFRGFGKVTEVLPTGKGPTYSRITYFHQGGGKDLSSHGEYQDSRFKAGMPYDVATFDASGNLYHETLSQITQAQVDPNGVYFPFATNVFERDSEPGAPLRATLKQYTYAVTNNLAASTGNLLQEADLGEVTNVQYGYTWSAVPGQKRYTSYTYATLSNPNIVDLPSSETISADAAGANILRQTLYQYFGATGDLQEKSELVCPSTYANTYYTYDNYGNPVTTTDPMNIVTTVNYDQGTATFPWRKVIGNLTNTMLADPRTGDIFCATNEQGIVTSNSYDALLRLSTSAISTNVNGAPLLQREKYAYSLSGISGSGSLNYVCASKNDPASASGWHDTYTYLDGLGRPVQVRDLTETNNVFRETDIGYDNHGQIFGESYPVFSSGAAYVAYSGTRTNTLVDYDAIGRPFAFYPCAKNLLNSGQWGSVTTLLTGDSNSPAGPSSVAYQDGNNPWALVVTNSLGKVHKYLLDAFGRTNQIIEVTSSGYFTTSLAYDLVDELTNITDSANNSIAMYYDLAGRRVALADPDMGFWQYDYDLDGRLKTQTDAKGQQLRLFYNDAAGRLTRHEGWNTAGQCVSTNTWQYDSNAGDTSYAVLPGQVYEITDDEGWEKFSYDPRGRTLKTVRYLVKNGLTYTNQATYDDADRVSASMYPNGGPMITNVYDAGGHLLKVSQMGSTNFYTAKGFNELEQLNGINFGNGVGATNVYYPMTKRLQQIVTAKSTNVQSLAYSYDADGNIKGIIDGVYTGLASGTVGNVQYDDLNRVLSLTNGSGSFNYGYNSIGNVLTNTESSGSNYVYGAIRPHAVLNAHGMWYTYDQNGNVVFRNAQRLNYDVNNHLYQVINTNGVVTTFGYDVNGERLWELSGTNSLQVWIGSGYEEKQGQVLYHILAGGRTVCTVDKTGTNVYEYYHPDELGSTAVQTDQNGNQIQNYEYSAFGQSRFTQNTNLFKVSRRYTGQVLDDGTGLYYYNARYYDPVTARFTQPDGLIPNVFDPQSYNRYSYCVNNPLRYTDPSGHAPGDDEYDPTEHLSLTLGGNHATERRMQSADSARLYNQAGPELKAAAVVLRSGAELNPVVGGFDGIKEAGTGQDQITYDKLSGGQRFMSGASGVASVVPGAAAAVGKVAKAVKEAAEATGVVKNAVLGAEREAKTAAQLAAENPTKVVQSERTLRDANGNKVIDPVTGEGRRVDHAVIDREANTAKTYETTSLTADKTGQLAKEQRIRDAGGTYIRDQETRKLVPVEGVSTVVRQQ